MAIVNRLNQYLAVAVMESSQVKMQNAPEKMPSASGHSQIELAVAIANQTLKNPAYSPSNLDDSEKIDVKSDVYKYNYADIYSKLFADSEVVTLLSLPGIYRNVGSPVTFSQEFEWTGSKQPLSGSPSDLSFVNALKYVAHLYDDEEESFEVRCLVDCVANLNPVNSPFFKVPNPHKVISAEEVRSELTLRIQEVRKRIAILRAIHDDGNIEKSWINKESLEKFDVKSTENEAVTMLPLGTSLAKKIRFKRLYVVLRMLIYLDPVAAGKFLAQFSKVRVGISGENETVSDSFCYAIRIIDFEVNVKAFVDNAITAVSTLSMLVPVGTLVKAAYLVRTAKVTEGFLKTASIGLNSSLNTFSAIPYAVAAFNEKTNTESLHQAFSNFVGNLDSTIQVGDRKKVMANFLEVHERFEAAYTEFLVAAVTAGGAVGIKSVSSAIQRLAKSTRTGRLTSAKNYTGELANLTKSVSESCR
jgi:hypothetical protein